MTARCTNRETFVHGCPECVGGHEEAFFCSVGQRQYSRVCRNPSDWPVASASAGAVVVVVVHLVPGLQAALSLGEQQTWSRRARLCHSPTLDSRDFSSKNGECLPCPACRPWQSPRFADRSRASSGPLRARQAGRAPVDRGPLLFHPLIFSFNLNSAGGPPRFDPTRP